MTMQQNSGSMATQPGAPVEVTLTAILNDAWDGFKANFAVVFAAFLVFVIITMVVSYIPVIGTLIVTPPLSVGFYLIMIKANRRQNPEFGDLFKGFSLIVPAIIAYIIMVLLIVVGLVLLIVPGIILALMYSMVFYLFADDLLDIEANRKDKNSVGGWAQLKRSADMVKGWKLTIFGYGIVIGLIVIAGVIAIGVGVLFTAPLGMLAMASMYDRIKAAGPRA